MTQPSLINLHPNEYGQEFHWCAFANYIGNCNTLNDFSNKACFPNKTEDLDLSMDNMITGINESKTLTSHISSECKCKFDGRKCNSDQNIMFGTLLHVIAKIEDIYQVLWMIQRLCVMKL